MDSGASNHVTGLASLINSYDARKHTQHIVSIRDGNRLSILGFGKVFFFLEKKA